MFFSWLNETWPLWTDHIGLLITIGTFVWIVVAWILSQLLQVMGIPQPQLRVSTPYLLIKLKQVAKLLQEGGGCGWHRPA